MSSVRYFVIIGLLSISSQPLWAIDLDKEIAKQQSAYEGLQDYFSNRDKVSLLEDINPADGLKVRLVRILPEGKPSSLDK